MLQPGFRLVEGKVFGVAPNGRLLTYYLVLVVVAAAFLVLLRVVNSPFGRVLQAIRENPFRAEALGYRIVFHRTLATCISALGATLAGALSALWLRYVGPDTALSFSIQVDVLVMVVVGGMGSLYGAILGAALFVFAESYLQAVMGALSEAAQQASLPLLPALFHPDRWLMWLGLAFVLAVYFAPTGIVGALKPSEAKGDSIGEDCCSFFRGEGDPSENLFALNHARRERRQKRWMVLLSKPIPKPSILDDFEFLGFVSGERRWRSDGGKRLYTWGGLHGEIEVFTRRGDRLGSLDPVTGALIKLAVKGRRIDV